MTAKNIAITNKSVMNKWIFDHPLRQKRAETSPSPLLSVWFED